LAHAVPIGTLVFGSIFEDRQGSLKIVKVPDGTLIFGSKT